MRPSPSLFSTSWLSVGIDLLFPPRCRFCRREGDPWRDAGDEDSVGKSVATGVCPACTVVLVDDGDRCLACGAPGTAAGCGVCRGRGVDHDGIVVLGRYEGELREAVLRAKRPAARDIAVALGRLLHSRHAETIAGWGVDAVVPVPMHWRRRLFRGGSTADTLAASIARAAGLPYSRPLRRARATVMQNRLPRAERRRAVRGAFAAGPAGVAGRRLLLVDDVVTSGGTIAACRRVLADAGAAAVFVAVIARADRGGDDDVPDAGGASD